MTDRKTIAVLGASRDRRKFGNKCVRAYLEAEWKVYPVNLAGGRIEGLPAFRRLRQVPADLERISVYLQPEATRRALPEIVAKGAREVWLNPGSASPEVVEQAIAAGLAIRAACSIVDIGARPGDFP